MAPSVTPARRRRNVVAEEDEADSGSGASRASKRARSSSPDSPSRNPPLPNGFLAAHANGLGADGSVSSSQKLHQPGSIVRVKLRNFVTYSAVEFFPGPTLNMVIGPNGTGKSTLVCAICIGLGWETKYLGRQKEVSEFVKHGEADGRIEIELQRKPRQNRNPVITCQVKRDANKTVYAINGRTCSKKQVQELARSFSIQVDNLCQFLPQDKVVEFAAMTPVDLLHSTQQAVASKQMIRWHKQLSEWRQNQRKVEQEMATGQETLKNLESRQRTQESDVARVREREEVKKIVEQWKLLKPFVRYQEIGSERMAQKRRKEEAERDLDRLRDELEPALRAVNAKNAYCDAIKIAQAERAKAVEQADKDCADKAAELDAMQRDFTKLDADIEREKKALKDDRVEMTRLQDGLKTIESQMRNEPPAIDLMSINENMRTKERRIIELREDDRLALTSEFDKAREDAREIQQKKMARKRDLDGLESRAGQQDDKLRRASAQTHKAWKYVQEHQSLFEKPIFGPPMIECSVKDPQYVPLMEALFQRNDFLYLVAQTRSDFRKLHELVKERLKLPEVNIRTSMNGLERFPPPAVSVVDMQRWGFEGWALDFMDGPEPVLAALCETCNLNRTAVALQDTTQAQFDAIVAKGNIQSWVTSKSYYRVNRRREYGPDAVSTIVKEVRPAQIWTDQPVDPEARREIMQEIDELTEQFEELKAKAQAAQERLKGIGKQIGTIQGEIDLLKKEKDEHQKIQSIFKALPTRKANQEQKIQVRERRLDEAREKLRQLMAKKDDMTIARGQATITYTETTETLLAAHQALHEAEVMLIEGRSDHETLVERNQTVKQTLDERQKEVQAIEDAFKKLTAEYHEALAEAKRLTPTLSDADRAFVSEHGKKSIADVAAELASAEARLELMHGGSSRVLAEFEERARRIEQLQRRRDDCNAALADINANIGRVRARWEPKLDHLVRRISDAFAFNMRQIHCAGEVSIHKDADFDQWAIRILVKFREHEALTQLDAHRQSGGERAVSTVFYLMSLQALTRAPFRVVDEINQGMDPRNERLVHGRMVAIATGNDEWEQYYRDHLAGSASWQAGADGGTLGAAAGNEGEDEDAEADEEDTPQDDASDEEDDDEEVLPRCRNRRGAPDSAANTTTRAVPEEEEEDGHDEDEGEEDAHHGAAQYFLITPKLLHGLRYDEGMTVLCIASGEHLAAPEAVDFGRALAMRRRAVAAS